MKMITYTGDQLSQLVAHLNRIRVTGMEQATELAMVRVILDDGKVQDIPEECAEGEPSGGKEGVTGETEGHC